jgi:hypothetical protein
MDRHHILLAMPGPHIRFTLAQSAFCCIAKGHQMEIVGADAASWDNMNVLWCTALNAAKNHGVTHFAMIHADIVPVLDQDWVNIMLADMAERDLDFISAVVPIKDTRGMTSSGIGDPADPWVPYRRFTMHEIYSFPPTFNQDEIGYPSKDWYLNHNSGMIIADLRKPVFRKSLPDGEMAIWFEFRKRMYFDENGEAKLVGESEDWNISRRLWLAGAKTAITRKPALKHYGMVGHPNTHPWGDQLHDKGCEYKWKHFDPIGDIKSPVSRTADPVDSIRGWLFPGERAELERLAAGKNVVEFGCYCGKSTVAMARVAEHVTAVDDFRGVAPHACLDSGGKVTTPGHETELMAEFADNIWKFGVKDKVSVIVGTAESKVRSIPLAGVGLVFYDADHSYEATYHVGCALFERMIDEGLNCTIAFHDYNADDPGVIKAVKQLSREFKRSFRVVSTLAIFDASDE